MGRSKQQESKQRSKANAATLAKALAPEDIQVGDVLTTLYTVTEFPSCFWCADATTVPLEQTIRVYFMPVPAGIPLKVQSVCLPFILVKRPFGDRQTLDVRQCRFAKLGGHYAAAAWKAHQKGKAKKSRK